MSDEQGPLKYGQDMVKKSSEPERPAKLRWYTNPPALLITYSTVSGNEKLVNTIRRAQSPKIAMDCGCNSKRCLKRDERRARRASVVTQALKSALAALAGCLLLSPRFMTRRQTVYIS